MKYKLTPYPHQIQAIEMSKTHPNLALLWEMGTGKTGGMINILRHQYKKDSTPKRTLILSPLVTLFNWENEFQIHSDIDPLDVIVVHGRSSKQKAKIFTYHCECKITKTLTKDKVVITNYETLRNKEMLAMIREWGPEIVVCDEAQVIKNPKAQVTKAVMSIGDRAKNRYFLTGTLILNSIKDIFAPFRFLDNGETFGKNYHVFVNTYMQDENASWSNRPGYFPKLVPRTEKYEELTNKIYTKATRVLKKDVLKDLPPLIKVKRAVELGKEQAKYYKEMERDFITFVKEKKKAQELSGAVVAQLAITKALRLQQIAAGYVSTDDGEEIFIEKNPRLDVTRDLLNEIVIEGNHKCIIWCCFRANYKQLGDLCNELNIGHTFLTGEQTLEEKRDAMDKFNNDHSTRVIIANRRAGGIGINLVSASYSIVYSRNFSLGDELQSEARNHRGGSQIHERIVKIDLYALNTIDEHVLDALNTKQDISKRVIDFVEGHAK